MLCSVNMRGLVLLFGLLWVLYQFLIVTVLFVGYRSARELGGSPSPRASARVAPGAPGCQSPELVGVAIESHFHGIAQFAALYYLQLRTVSAVVMKG